MADPVAVKRALARLASDADGDADRAVISQGDAAVDDLEAAVSFVSDVGVSRLAVAVERQRTAGNAGAVAGGERALEAFRRYRRAAGTTTQPRTAGARGPDSEVVESQDDPRTNGTPASNECQQSNGCRHSNGDSGGELDAESFEHGLESIGVGIEPVAGDGPVDQFRGGDTDSGGESGGRKALSGWRTLDGEHFHSHSGYGNGLGTGSEEGRR